MVGRWFDRNILDLGRQMRLAYLPPLMVYLAAGISGLTAIVGTFFVKDYLGLSAEFLAMLGFWAGIPWVLKMPLGHLVDLIWRWKAVLVFFGASLIAAGLLIMLGLLGDREAMAAILPVENWFVLSVLLTPVGYVVQDVVADAMTVEAVPRVNALGQPFDSAQIKLMHTTMQTLGRVAIIGGSILVALANILMFGGVEALTQPQKASIYIDIYQMALAIPVISVIGVALGELIQYRRARRLRAQGYSRNEVQAMLSVQEEPPSPNGWILGGSLLFVLFSIAIGLNNSSFSQEIVFAGSLVIVIFLISRLVQVLDEDARRTLLGTALIIFVYRGVPTPGVGVSWWQIDVLGFDEHFLSVLSLIASALALFGMFMLRRFMAERSIAVVIGVLTIASTVLMLPDLSMFYGFHEWTARITGGVVDARFIALIDTALESPLGQVAMIPMLAWIANSAPSNLKATFFAVMASFTNLALSLSQLGTKYLNQIFIIRREVTDPATNMVTVGADYHELGVLLIVVTLLVLSLPLLAIGLTRLLHLHSA